MLNIEIEDVNTWPPQAQRILEQNFNLLASYAAKEIDYPHIPYPERHYAVNPHRDQYEQIIEQLEQELDGNNLVGYHCTRLLENEIINIQTRALEPLSIELLTKRVKKAEAVGIIPSNIASHLLANNLCSEECRKGMLWFVCGASMLKDEDGINKFFRGWGGESIYNCHQTDEFSGPIVMSVGKPCIIRAALMPNKINFYIPSISTKVVEAFLQKRDIRTPNNPQFDTNTNNLLPPEQILKIISIDDPEFQMLTNYQFWSKKLIK